MVATEKKKIDLVYPELSYQIVGVFYNVQNDLGFGYQEKYYQRAIVLEFKKVGIKFQEQISSPINFKGQKIGRYFLDFLVENKIVVEIKRHNKFHKKDIEQVYSYLKHFDFKLGILVSFTKNGVYFKRILNIH